jgi:hypothetical protein
MIRFGLAEFADALIVFGGRVQKPDANTVCDEQIDMRFAAQQSFAVHLQLLKTVLASGVKEIFVIFLHVGRFDDQLAKSPAKRENEKKSLKLIEFSV